MKLVLIGDIHLYHLALEPRSWLSRRVLGHSNLLLNRQYRFNHALLRPLFDKVRQIKPDMVLCSGDVTTTSLENEFADVARYFAPLAETIPTVVVPGNHDRYTFKSHRTKRMEQMLGGVMPQQFPHIRALTDRWHLLALDSAIPQVLWSRGALGQGQMSTAERWLLHRKAGEGVVVLCHYPAATPVGIPNAWSHAMAERRRLRHLLARCEARVVFMHGHIHRPWWWTDEVPVAGPGREGEPPARVEYINAGSPCLTSGRYPLGQGFWELGLPADPSDPLDLVHRVPMSTTSVKRARPRRRRRLFPDPDRWESRTEG